MNENDDKVYQKFWDSRYENPEFAYGKIPNTFFKEWIENLDPKSILMPADGEGRNGVFAAKLGWNVIATDLSTEGKNKALQLAKEKNVFIKYLVGDIQKLHFSKESFDAIGLIYAHFSASKISEIHQKLAEYLKPNGVVIFEGYSKKHLKLRKLNPNVGGPNDLDMLFSIEGIRKDFPNFEIKVLEEKEIELKEGNCHNGIASVIRFIGYKK